MSTSQSIFDDIFNHIFFVLTTCFLFSCVILPSWGRWRSSAYCHGAAAKRTRTFSVDLQTHLKKPAKSNLHLQMVVHGFSNLDFCLTIGFCLTRFHDVSLRREGGSGGRSGGSGGSGRFRSNRPPQIPNTGPWEET